MGDNIAVASTDPPLSFVYRSLCKMNQAGVQGPQLFHREEQLGPVVLSIATRSLLYGPLQL